MKTTRRLHLEIQKHRTQAYGLIRSSYRENGRVKHTTHGRITGMSVSQLKLLQAAFRGEVVPKDMPQALQLLGSREHGASACVLALARELGLDRAIYSRRETWVEDVLAMIAGRVIYAGSKLALSNQWKNTTLWEQCGVKGPVDVDAHCYPEFASWACPERICFRFKREPDTGSLRTLGFKGVVVRFFSTRPM